MSQALIENAMPWAAPAAAWMLTYLLHSTVLLALAAAVAFALGERRMALQEVIWKCALIGGLATASLQAGLGWTPLAGSWELPGTAGVVAAEASEPRQQEGAPLTSSTASGEVAASMPVGHRLEGTGSVRLAADGRSGGEAAGIHAGERPAGPEDRPLGAYQDRAAGSSPAFGGGAVGPGATLGTAWPLLAVVAWLAFALFFTGRLAADYLRLAARLRERWPVADGAVAALFGRLLGKSGRRRPVALTGSERLPVPIAWGLARPEVSLPARVLRDLSPYHQESILAHELAHVLRRDPAWLAAARLLEAVLFFQPLNRLARRRLQEIAEYRCDDRAVELTGRPLELARCLTEVAAWRLAGLAALPVPSMASGSSLGRRVRRLVQQVDHPGEPGERLPRWVRPAAVAAVLAVALAAPGVTRGKPAPQEPSAAPAGAEAGVAGAGEAEASTGEPAAGEGDDRGWVVVGGRSWDELTPEERDEVRRDVAAARRHADEAGREAREHARQALEHAREQLRHQRHALRTIDGVVHPHGLEGLSGLIGESVRLGLTAAGTALAALDMPEIQAEVARAMAEVQREMPKMQAEIARALAEAEHDPHRQAELAEAMAELEAEMPRIEAEIAAAMAEVEHELALEMPKIQAEVAAAMAEVQRELAAEMPKIQAEVAAAMAEAERELAREMPEIEAEIERALAEVERELAEMEAEMKAEERELDEEAVESEELDEP